MKTYFTSLTHPLLSKRSDTTELKRSKCYQNWKINYGQNGHHFSFQVVNLTVTILRSWILAWQDRRRVKWRVMSWRAGTEHLRSYSTGCTTVRQVGILPSFHTSFSVCWKYSRILQYAPTKYCIFVIKILSARLPHSGCLVSRLYPGWDDYRPGAVPGTWQHPHTFSSLCCQNGVCHNHSF